MRAFEVQVWSASVSGTQLSDWGGLLDLLDPSERQRCAHFRFEPDRQSFLLAHALRRLALAQELGVDPKSLMFSHDANGKPSISGPAACDVFFSLSHTREQVAFALSFDGPVGIDVETVSSEQADHSILDGFVAWPDDALRRDKRDERPIGLSDAQGRDQFYFYWTALEAFWKAAGTGLSSANPKIRYRRNDAGLHEISLDGSAADDVSACVIPVRAAPGHAMSLAVGYFPEGARIRRPGNAMAIRASEKTHFFGCKRRYLRSSLTTIVSA
jgi:4'-phosphopantetheinyl transferase